MTTKKINPGSESDASLRVPWYSPFKVLKM